MGRPSFLHSRRTGKLTLLLLVGRRIEHPGKLSTSSPHPETVTNGNVQQYGSGYPGPECGKTITLSYGGKTAQAVILDQVCCGDGDPDAKKQRTLTLLLIVPWLSLWWSRLDPWSL